MTTMELQRVAAQIRNYISTRLRCTI